MVETNENVKNTMDAACSKEDNKSLYDNSPEEQGSILVKNSSGEEKSSNSSNEQDDCKSQNLEESNVEKSSVEKPSVENPSMEKPSMEKSSVEKSSVEKSSVEKSSVEKSSMEKPSVEKSSVEKPSMEKPIVENPSVEKSSVEKSSVEKPSVEKSSVEKPSVEKSSVEKPSFEKPSVEKSSVEKSSVEISNVEISIVEKSIVEISIVEKSIVEKSSVQQSSENTTVSTSDLNTSDTKSESGASESISSKDSKEISAASESDGKTCKLNEKISKCENDNASIVNGEETLKKEESEGGDGNGDTCESTKDQQDPAPVDDKSQTPSNVIGESEEVQSVKLDVDSTIEKADKKVEERKEGEQEETSVLVEAKLGSTNEINEQTESEGTKPGSSASKKLESAGADDTKREAEEAKSKSAAAEDDTTKEDPSKTTSTSKKKSVKPKAPPKVPVPNESGRSTRSSNNPDFAAKQRSFLNKVQNAYSSLNLLEAASSMSESEGDDNSSDSSYSDQAFAEKVVSPSEKKSGPPSAEKKVVCLPAGLAEKLAEKSRALLSDKKLTPYPFTIGDKKLASLPAGDKKLVTFPMSLADKKTLLASVNGVKRKRDDLSPLNAGARTFYELDEEQTLTVPTCSKIDSALSRKRKTSSSVENTDVDSEDCSSPAAKLTTAAMASKKGKLVRVDETGKESQISCDVYCWFCHREGATIMCKTCPRVYHLRCLVTGPPEDSPGMWVCPMCVTILKAESTDSRSRAMKMLTLDQFCLLLSCTVARMKSCAGSEVFCKPVDPKEFPMYSFYIVHPMDISQLERNIKSRVYGSTEAFLADVSWIVHNCAIFNSLNHKLTYLPKQMMMKIPYFTVNNKLTHMAKQILKICRQEIADIENCPDCYLYAHTGRPDWFLEVCRRPHLLVLAKLKGFPFWPAKAMQCNSDGMVDVRFFGAHDRAWVPAKECLLYSRSIPTPKKKKKTVLDGCIEELEQHVTYLEACFGEYVPADGRIPLDPNTFEEQLQASLPAYKYPEAMRMPIAFSNEVSVKLCEETLKAEYEEIAAGTAPEFNETSVTDEDGEVTHSDSLQSDKEEMLSGKPKRARLSREAAVKTILKGTGGKSTGSKATETRPRRETRKSGIVDRLSEKLALLDDDQSKTPPQSAESMETADNPSEERVETEREPLSKEQAEVTTSAAKEKPLEAESASIKMEPISPGSNVGESATPKSTPVSLEKETPKVDEVKREHEDSSFSMERVPRLAAAAAAAVETNETLPAANESESPSKLEEPVMKRRSMRTAASAVAASTASAKAKPTVVAAAKGKSGSAKAATPATESGKKSGKTPKGSGAGNSGVASKKRGQADGTSAAKSDTPKKITPPTSTAPISVVLSSSPQEKFTARKSVPGGNTPKNISLIKASNCPLPPSMSASPTIVSSTVRLQTSAPSQQSVQVLSNPSMPSLTVAPISRNTSLLTSSVKTSMVTTMAANSNIVNSTLGSGGSLLLSSVGNGSTPATISSVSVVSGVPNVVVDVSSSGNMPTLSSAPTSVKTSVTTCSPLAASVSSFAPSVAGPHAAGIRSHAAKLTEFFCGMIEDTIKDIGGKGNASATIKALQLEFERLNWQHSQEMAELRHNTTLVVEEIKKTFETEKVLAIKDALAARSTLAVKEKEAAIIATKRKQWCAFCLKEALFYCCWNTSYCDYSCQQKHWPVHSMYCTQNEGCDDAVSPNIPNIPSGGTPKPLIIRNSNTANGANTTTVNSASGTVGSLMPVISARSSVSLQNNANSPTYVLTGTMPNTTTTGSTIFVPSRPTAPTTNAANARPYVLPPNVRIRPSAPGQKVVLRQGGKSSTSPGQQNQVVFVVNNQKNKN